MQSPLQQFFSFTTCCTEESDWVNWVKMNDLGRSSRQSVSVAKQEMTIMELEYMNIKDSDDSRVVKSLQQTYRHPLHHLQRRGDQSKFEVIVEENGNSHLGTVEEIGPAEKKTTVYQITDMSPLGVNSSFRRRSCSMNPIPKVRISTFQSKPRKLQRSNSIAGTERSLKCVRIVLIGKTGVGKSATGNTILGRDVFRSRSRMKSVTKMCQRETGDTCGRPVTVVDTPGLFDTSLSNEDIQQEIMRCIELLAPGPHVFLLVIAVSPFTQEERETLQLIKMTFGQKAEAYTMVLFTRGDNLDESIEDYIKDGDPLVQQLIHDCGGRFHVFNNKQKDPDQVVSLLKKIDKMMWNNNASFYNDKMFLEAERAFRLMQINREREEELRQEMEAIKAKYESEIKEIQDKLEEEKAKLKVRDLLLMEKDNILLRNLQTGRERDTSNTEQILNRSTSKAPSERMKNEKLSGQKKTAQGATGGESDRDKKKQPKKLVKIESFLKRGRQRKSYQRRMEDYDANETEIQEQNREETIHAVTNKKIRKQIFTKPKDQTDTNNEDKKMYLPENSEDERNLNKNKLLHEQYKEIEECKQKMEEIKKRYKEIEEIHAAELKKMKKRHADNITVWNKTHGNCVLQ